MNKNEVKYYSTDKMYKINNKNNNTVNNHIISYMLLILSILGIILGLIWFNKGITINGKDNKVGYSETGSADYTVYLKDNTFYDSSYLASGMKYVANLINTVNTKFNYEIHSTENLDLNYKYKIVGTLNIMDKDDSTKVLYTKDEVLLDEVTLSDNSNNLVINEDVSIDYNKYNNIVNEYKQQFGVSVTSEFIVKMAVSVTGETNLTTDSLSKANTLQITIPLSEQTVDITIDTDEINKSSYLSNGQFIVIKNNFDAFLSIIILFISIISLITDYKLFKEYNKNNIYKVTVSKILKEYDQLIVTGSVSIDEKKYSNIVHPKTFIEMVDAAENLNAPILYYEVIPGEKCFFVLTKDDTLYKYRLTKAYLEREELEENK